MFDLIIIDTDILIDVSHNQVKAVSFLESLDVRYHLGISVVTQLELIVGCRNKQESAILDNFLKRFQIINLNDAISVLAVELLNRYRLSHGLLIPDALIAATALYLDTDFVSKNQRDYRFIENLKLLPF